jgi:hypothetical protein
MMKMKIGNLGTPMKTVRRMNEMKKMIRKEPPIEIPRHSCNETRPKLTSLILL